MKLYLSSYKIGQAGDKLKSMAPHGKIGYIANALDFAGADPERRERHIERDVDELRALGLETEVINLQDFFGKQTALEEKVNNLGAVFVSGGNAFVLRQAFSLSGFDKLLLLLKDRDFLYAGYSAGGCVLAPTLKPYEPVDKPEAAYGSSNIIWEGLGLLDFIFIPHWESDHRESEEMRKVVEFCKKNSLAYKTVRDGEVLII